MVPVLHFGPDDRREQPEEGVEEWNVVDPAPALQVEFGLFMRGFVQYLELSIKREDERGVQHGTVRIYAQPELIAQRGNVRQLTSVEVHPLHSNGEPTGEKLYGTLHLDLGVTLEGLPPGKMKVWHPSVEGDIS